MKTHEANRSVQYRLDNGLQLLNQVSGMAALRFCWEQGVCLHICRRTEEVLDLVGCGGDAYASTPSNYYFLWCYCELDAWMNVERVDVLSSFPPIPDISNGRPGGVRTFPCTPFWLRVRCEPSWTCFSIAKCCGGTEQLELLSSTSVWLSK